MSRVPAPELGVVLDSSHMSATDLDLRILAFAQGYGFRYVGTWPDGTRYSPEDVEYAEVMRDLADSAVDWLNDFAAPEGAAYVVEDNSLYLWAVGDELGHGVGVGE